MTTARSTNQGKSGILGSKKNKHMVLWSTKPVDGSFPKRRYITFSDCLKAGTFKRWGTCDLHFYQQKQIKRVRVVRRADGYQAQLCLDKERLDKRELTVHNVGIDVGLNHLYTDSDGQTVANPQHLGKSEKSLKRIQCRMSKSKKGSKNRAKFRNKLARKHLRLCC